MQLKRLMVKLGLDESCLVGDKERDVLKAGTLSAFSIGDVVYCKKGNETQLDGVHGCVIIIHKSVDKSYLQRDNSYVLVENPRLIFLRMIKLIHSVDSQPHIAENCFIHSSTYIDKTVSIGPFVYIGENCRVENRVRIYPNVTILNETVISEGCVIFPGTVIGGDGFGYERNECNQLEKVPHVGGVFIGKNVDIGSCVAIDRGTIDKTEIGEGTKIDNLVHIAHNVKIGKHCEIIANAMIGGSTRIGDYTRLAPGAQIMNGLSIGNNVLVGLGAVVTKDVPDNKVVAGVPARDIEEFKRYLKFVSRNIT